LRLFIASTSERSVFMLRRANRRARQSRRRAALSSAVVNFGCEPLERRLCLAITFGSPTTFSVTGGAFTGTDMEVGDFNRDQKADVLLGYRGQSESGPA